MQSVYVLVRVKPGNEGRVAELLQGLSEATEVHPLFGEFDFIVKLQAPSHEALTQIIIEKIRSHGGIAATKTLVKTSF